METLTVKTVLLEEINDAVVLSLSGFIDTTNAKDVEKHISHHISERRFKIILNLDQIDFISSAGWGIFVGEIKKIRHNRGDLVLACMTPDVQDVFEVMEFSTIIKSFDAIQEAVEYFRKLRV